MGNPVYATTDTYVDPSVRLQRGQIWDDEDPIVQQHPGHFTDDPYAHGLVRHSGTPPTRTDTAGAVETATAAPGEKRARTSSTRG